MSFHPRPRKILHIVGAMNIAGTETLLMNIYRNIDRSKVQFDFISYEQNAAYDEEIRKMGGRVIKLVNTQSLKELYDAIKKYGPYQAVHAHTLFHCGIANIAAKLAGVGVRVSHAHTTLDKSDSLIRKIYVKSMRYVINRYSTHLLACSKEAGRYLFGDKILNNSKFEYFPNLIDYRKFFEKQSTKVNEFKLEQGIENSIVIGHIGRFIKAKNHMFLLDIIKILSGKNSNVKLLLVGDGDLRLQIEEQAKKLGIYDRVRFTGLRNDIHVVLQCMDIFVFPSIHEGLGLVLLEAQASGLPCVVSEAIQPEADLNIDLIERLSLRDGANVWADKILELVNKRENDQKRIAEGFEISGYSLPGGISKLMKIYDIALEDV